MLLDTTTNGVYVVGGVPTAVPAPLPTPVPAPAPTSLLLPVPSALPLPAPTAVPTCVEIIDGSSDSAVTIDEDDCKVWEVIGSINSLTARRQRVSLGRPHDK